MISVILTFLSLRHGSQSCRFHEQNFSDVEQILVQTFKKKLLKELGFSSVPNVSQARVPKIPSFYKHFIEAENNKPNEATGLDENDFDARTKQLFYFSKQGAFFFLFFYIYSGALCRILKRFRELTKICCTLK